VSAYLNLTYQHKLLGNEMELMAGGMMRHKTRDNYYNEYSLSPLPLDGPGRQYYTTYDNAQFNFVPAGSANGTPVNPNTYTATEDIQAGYIQAKYYINHLQVLAGVRVETTVQNYDETTEPAESFVGKTGTITYMDVLPGVHLKYSITQKQNLRLSWYESISRPGFFEITPYQIPGEYFDEVGNPFLKHTTADNIDLRWEYFPKGRDQILLGAFYKNIQDPIEYAFVQIGGPSTLYLQPKNFGNATNYGIEAVYTKYIGNFGINANYTYTNSAITTTKELYFRDNEGSLTHSFEQVTRPLQGQAAHVANLSLIYKDTKHGLDLQLACVYTGRHIVELSAYEGLDYWQRATTQLDFSFEKSINKHISVYGKVTNILNTPVIVELDKPNIFRSGQNILPDQTSDKSITVEKDIYYQTYLLGLRFKL
jgi:TonB-dependent receptor